MLAKAICLWTLYLVFYYKETQVQFRKANRMQRKETNLICHSSGTVHVRATSCSTDCCCGPRYDPNDVRGLYTIDSTPDCPSNKDWWKHVHTTRKIPFWGHSFMQLRLYQLRSLQRTYHFSINRTGKYCKFHFEVPQSRTFRKCWNLTLMQIASQDKTEYLASWNFFLARTRHVYLWTNQGFSFYTNNDEAINVLLSKRLFPFRRNHV